MKKSILILFFLGLCTHMSAQDLMEILDEETPQHTEYISATFKGTRIINGHSIENRKKGVLEFLISHRFGRINDGIDEFFGLDDSNIRFALEYALTDNLMFGVGRSSFEKTYDGFVKYKLLKQATGKKPFPLSVSLFGSAAWKTLKDYDPEDKPDFSDRLFYTTQVLMARKFNENLSLQLSPTYVHRNSVKIDADPHDIFAVGAGGRYKISKRVSVNAEYFYTVNPLKSVNTKDVFALSVDIETGGHVFQLMLSNALTMIEKAFITETTDDFFSGDIHFGFNISRAFHLGKKHRRIPDEGEQEW
ncbi:DUF5777 family beta-barrel protein [Sinomicrobium weinanense]|uniref:DUF5777 domain-containing protein n=1 Tax=Sinomicrobium weinanense TaxID=2842200 RepID=A0A926JVK8_9FLAO|nr:DUF5777 family beta-barrel protein [Sinomicrobium weinanense]MBC9797976.1 hypothetical protein [Sinomicrobium weinanense]MBU3125507.1 hypothetical protein [Sinomicrobium weinanense]